MTLAAAVLLSRLQTLLATGRQVTRPWIRSQALLVFMSETKWTLETPRRVLVHLLPQRATGRQQQPASQ
ncbi:MAG: hypothetical protein R3B96_11570 [Pirellulaceae bacterium]